jgi:hypothetical protein
MDMPVDGLRQAEAEQLRAEMEESVTVLRADLAAVHQQLAAAREEARLLREWRTAHIEHQRAKQELLALQRRRALEAAWAVEFDALTMTVH